MTTQTLIDALRANAVARSSLVASLVPDTVVVPPETDTNVIHSEPLDLTSITALERQYYFDRYERYQKHTCLIADTASLTFYCTSLAAGGLRLPLPYPQYGLLFDGVERGRATVTNFGKDGSAVFTVTLGDQPDGPTMTQIVAYNADGSRATPASGTLMTHWIWVDRKGEAKNCPYVLIQNSTYDWTHGTPTYQWVRVLKSDALGNSVLPLVPRDPVPFATALPPVQITRINYAPPADNHQCARGVSTTLRGIVVADGKQGYFADDTVRAFSQLPLVDGPRGLASSEMTLSLYAGRNNKIYGCSPYSLWTMDGTGTKKTLFGQRHKYSAYWEELAVGHPAIEFIGTPDASVPAGTEIFPKECWSITFDERSTVTDPNATPIGGEHPHPGDVIAFLPDARGWIWKLRFNGHDPNRATDHPEPPRVSIFAYCDDPWAVRVKAGIVYATVRNEARIAMWNADTGAFIGNVISDAGAMNAVSNGFKFVNETARVWLGAPAAVCRTRDIVAPEGLWLADSHIYWGSYAMAEVRRVPVTYGANGATVTGPIERCCQPYIDQKSRYVLIEMCRPADSSGPAGSFGPPETLFVSTWTNSNNNGRPVAYLNKPGVEKDGTPMTHTSQREYNTVSHYWTNDAMWIWNTLGGGAIQGCSGTVDATYSTAVAVGHGALYCCSAEAGIERFIQADYALDKNPVDTAAIARGYAWYIENLSTLYGPFGYGFLPPPFGKNADCDYLLGLNGL